MIPSNRLHSIHNPEREADRFVESVISMHVPVFIVVSEPGESWIANSLQRKYPSAIRIALRYTTSFFSESDSFWDYVWRPENLLSVSDFLFNIIPDEYLPLTQFIPWKPSDSVWPEESIVVWNEISEMIKKQQSVMYTRTHFGNRWLKNIFKNCLFMNTIRTAEYTEKMVLLAAAGPSLESFFPFNTSNMYVCAVSSALSCLEYNNCTPDICITTDGGFWALNHFRNLKDTVPVCFPLEAAIPTTVLQKNPLVLLDYGSALENFLFSILKIKSEKAERNGTVAGTAASYLLKHSSSSVFASGLDLCSSVSFPHARPHASDFITLTNSRYNSIAGMLYEQNITTNSFSIYRDWFSSRNTFFKSRFFRIKPVPSHILGITDIDKDTIKGHLDTPVEKPLNLMHCEKPLNIQTRKEIIESVLSSLLLECRSLRKIEYFIFATNIHEKSNITNLCSATLEFLQMVSYTDYISALKKMRNSNENDIESLHILCNAGENFIAKLSIMVKSMTC